MHNCRGKLSRLAVESNALLPLLVHSHDAKPCIGICSTSFFHLQIWCKCKVYGVQTGCGSGRSNLNKRAAVDQGDAR